MRFALALALGLIGVTVYRRLGRESDTHVSYDWLNEQERSALRVSSDAVRWNWQQRGKSWDWHKERAS